jgi:hypothetical protein
MYEEAIAAHQKVVESIPAWKPHLGITYARAGRMEEAREVLAEIEQGGTSVSPMYLAGLYAALGEEGKAFRSLKESCDLPEAYVPSIRIDPFFEPLRDDPRFLALLKRMNLPPP